MQKAFFIIALLAFLVSGVWAQKKVLRNRELNYEMPESCGKSVDAVITVADANNKEVKKITRIIQVDKQVNINVSTLKPGKYSIKVTSEKMKGSSGDLIDDVIQIDREHYIVLTLWHHVERQPHGGCAKKPVIYLYPEREKDITVSVDFKGEITETIPAYNGGWKVSATPDGKTTNYGDGMEYPYLFWEGNTDKQDWDMNEGFIVGRDKSREFLETQLCAMGLTAKEYNEFIDFWAPELQKNEYNLIHFAGCEYEDLAKLTVDPKPDAILRVFMVFKPANRNTQATPQHFKPFVRKGFTVVEWGGMELDKRAKSSAQILNP